MEQYIPKSALVAKIEEIITDEAESIKSFEHRKNVSEVQRSNARMGVLTHLRSLINTLEVKEVDIEKEAERFVQTKEFIESTESPVILVAKHFFELGMQASNKTQKGE